MEENTQAANVDVSNVSTSENPASSNTQVENTQPDITTTQAFSQRLKESTQKAVDAEYSRLYGVEYNIHSKAEYDSYLQKQEEERQSQEFQQKNGFDPNSVKPLFEQWKKNDPDFQELSQIRQEKHVSAALNDLNSELKDCGLDLQLKDLSETETSKLPNVQKITELVQKGKTLAEAFFLANKKEILSGQVAKAQQDTINKITQNGNSSPGSLNSGTEQKTTNVWDMSDADFKAMQKKALGGELSKR